MDHEIAGTQVISIDMQQYVAAVYSPFRERLEAAKAEAKGVTFDVTTEAGMKVAIAHRNAFRDIRIEAEKARVLRKEPVLEIGRLLDSKAKEIEAQIAPHEARFADPIKAENDKEKLAAKARQDAEVERIKAEERAKREAEEKAMAEARAEIARQQAELAAQQKAARDKIEQEERAARMRIEESERAARLEREAADAKARAAQRAEEDRLRAIEDARRKERDRLAAIAKAESDRLEAIAKAERDAKEAAERKKQEDIEAKARAEREKKEKIEEEKRIAAMLIKDGYLHLQGFVHMYGNAAEFAPIVVVIQQFLSERK